MQRTNKLPVQPQINKIRPYKPGMPIEELARQYSIDPKQIIKLASNENPYGMSPKAQQAIKRTVSSGALYPDGYSLRQKLAAKHHIHMDNVVLGNGSNDVLDLVARIYLGPDTESISSQYGFLVFQLVTSLTGATNVVTPAKEYDHDLGAMLAAITNKTRVIWIANPNNPTGTYIPQKTVINFLNSVPNDVVVVLDEAYCEYLTDKQPQEVSKLIQAHPNLVLTRTFSKIYGLAGLRVGYALTNLVIAELLNRVRQPFNVNSLAIAAAEAALDDQAFVKQCKTNNKLGLSQIEAGLKSLGLAFTPSHGNFVMFEHPKANQVYRSLLSDGIIIRPLVEYGLANHLRASVGTKEQNDYFLKSLQKALKG